MSDGRRYLLRKVTGDQAAESEQDIRDWFQTGQCKPADFVFDFTAGKWLRAGELPGLADLFAAKPAALPEKRLIYYMSPGATPLPQGPFSTKEIQGRMQSREVCELTWVFVDGDKEWRQVRNVKVLLDMLPPLPKDVPAPPAPVSPPPSAPDAAISLVIPPSEQSSPSIRLDLSEGDAVPPPAPMPAPADDFPEREEATMALSTLGLSLKVDHTQPAGGAPPPPPAPASPGPPPLKKPPVPPAAAPSPPPAPPSPAPAGAPPGFVSGSAPPSPPREGEGNFDGITAEISMEPIWLVKQSTSEAVSGPFRFLEVMKFLEEGRLNKNDKVSKAGSNRFVKIQQQYEFNVKYTVETVIEHGVERQKIFIKRRHPRVPYFTGVQVIAPQGLQAGNCVNISAGGILVENLKAEFNLGDILETKILPGLINRSISCKAMVIGKIPKMPPAYALKFEDLKTEDKEAIEIYVQETLKRESKN